MSNTRILANYVRPDTIFDIFIRSATPNKRYMVDISTIILYLKITVNLGYFHQEIEDMTMI